MDKVGIFVAKCGKMKGEFVEKADKRYVTTHGKIKKTFENLVLTHPYSAITVSMLVQEVGINRKTFYLHYPSLDALVDEMVEDIAGETGAYLREHPARFTVEALEGFLQMLSSNLPLHKRLVCAAEYRFVFQRVCDRVTQQQVEHSRREYALDGFALRAAMEAISTVVMQTYRSWLMEDMPISAHELAVLINRLLTADMVAMLR